MAQRLFLLVKLIRESYLFALNAIIVNKLRTFLSLSGITIGIFSIISVFTVFDSIEREVKSSIASLGNNVLYIQKWPWFMGGGEYPWWKYFKRPEATLDELVLIQRRSIAAESSAFMVGTNRMVKYQNNSIEGASILAVSHDYDKIWNFELSDGRYFTQQESGSGRPVAIIGSTISENLFEGLDPLGRKIKVWGRDIEIIGVFKKEGSDNFGNSNDETVLIPVNYGRFFINLDRDDAGTALMIKAKQNISNEELKDELIGIMRSIRKLKPGTEDDFSINESTLITKGFESLFSVISLVGWIIGGFSLLVGGFGIANIMFVSVKERTTIIGIQKSLGAKNYFILLQFLFEAVFLSAFGGIFGLLIIYAGTLIVSWTAGMTLVLTAKNIILGVGVSILIGLVSGIIPAWSASRLDPVDAIRSTGA
ncbi:MAG: ABC transporter permease [Bacteroidales bacterium]